jgi:hypothetical protein
VIVHGNDQHGGLNLSAGKRRVRLGVENILERVRRKALAEEALEDGFARADAGSRPERTEGARKTNRRDRQDGRLVISIERQNQRPRAEKNGGGNGDREARKRTRNVHRRPCDAKGEKNREKNRRATEGASVERDSKRLDEPRVEQGGESGRGQQQRQRGGNRADQDAEFKGFHRMSRSCGARPRPTG